MRRCRTAIAVSGLCLLAWIQSAEAGQRVPRGQDDPRAQIERRADSQGVELGDSETGKAAERAGERPRILREVCEVELALSAAPENLRPRVGIFILSQDGYKRVRASNNGFDCIVNRDHPRAIKPTCFDAEGAAKIVPKIRQVGDWLLEGLSTEEVDRRVAAGFESGLFEPPSRPGVAYMLSNFNRPWDPRTETLGWFPPHVMFYAPDLTNEDIGFDPSRYSPERMLPLIAYQGPHGFMIMVTGENRPREKGELSKCPDWVLQ